MTLIDKAEALAVLRKAQVASCTCQIKTPDPEWHSHNCRYRILREAEAMIDHLPDAALPARGVGVKPDRTVGDFACAAIDFIETMQAHGFTAAAGQSDDDDLDFCIGLYRGEKAVGCASFHIDRSWSCYLEVGDKTFRCESTPWFKLPGGMKEALAALAPTEPPEEIGILTARVEDQATEIARLTRIIQMQPPARTTEAARLSDAGDEALSDAALKLATPQPGEVLASSAPAPTEAAQAREAALDAFASLDMARDKIDAMRRMERDDYSDAYNTALDDAYDAITRIMAEART